MFGIENENLARALKYNISTPLNKKISNDREVYCNSRISSIMTPPTAKFLFSLTNALTTAKLAPSSTISPRNPTLIANLRVLHAVVSLATKISGQHLYFLLK